eukprot:CAMPEP_0170889732 /NCGR_PEP_ID=MMETSP0734-20130129/39545_1 /TAXON_ID=186038 /ORGANISM="Fragilariopsis kerguelensis, Strain L26-C5" /LENGTH=305 /DNA_ID=CAMNT_0011278181 /DNA_START=101 /DNA_END=1018 /DNA_ORIENTATION=-
MNPSTEQTLETIEAMRRQEAHHGYCVTDYLADLPTIAQSTDSLDFPVDTSCRFAMAKWMNEIANVCHYKKDTIAIAMHCLDRFMATPSGHDILLDRQSYQLAAMTCLYSSVKIHEQEVLDTYLVSNLSKGVHTPAAIEAMEAKMLMAIHWRVHPPTAMSFVRMISDVILDTSLDGFREIIFDRTRQQIEMTVNHYEFCSYTASSIAFASMLNAIESCVLDDDDIFYTHFSNTVGKVLAIDATGINNLQQMIYKQMEENDIYIGMIPSHVSQKRLSYTDDEVDTVKGSFKKSSPRTVRISVATNAA